MRPSWIVAGVLLASLSGRALAGEVFGGVYAHGVDTPLSLGGSPEGGVDFQLGYRGSDIGRTRLQPYVFGAVNSSGDTSYASAGLSMKFGDRWYVRPGLGLAIHTGSDGKYDRDDDIAFGSRILFQPEFGIGAKINERLTVEASWVHMSHATLFSGQNPGIDNIGARLNWRL